jgi:hypothetical protein
MMLQVPICYYKHFNSEMDKLQVYPYVSKMVPLQRKIWKSPTGHSNFGRCKYCLKNLRMKNQVGLFRIVMQKLKDNIQTFININIVLRHKLRI